MEKGGQEPSRQTETEPDTRRRRANGERSRQKILDAAIDVAGERGYHGASMSLISERCGLPASSIYWHFEDKDHLMAAVIRQRFGAFISAIEPPSESDGSPLDQMVALGIRIDAAFADAPDFLRLGFTLTLDRHLETPASRRAFLEVRAVERRWMADLLRRFRPAADDATLEQLAISVIGTLEGLLITKTIDDVDVDLVEVLRAQSVLLLHALSQ